MTYSRKFLFGLLALGVLLSCTQTPQQRAENATVLIVIGNTDGSVGTGSGFFVERDEIATNIHVVDSGMVFAVSRKKVYNIEAVTGYDLNRDLVVLKVSGKGTPLELSEGQIGKPIYVVGYPGGGYKVTKGKVHGIRKSDKRLRLVAKGFPNTSDDLITHGNSGGPVLNSEWKVVGIAASGNEDFTHASASSALNALLDSPDKKKLSDWQERDPIRAYVYAAWGKKKLKGRDYKLAIEGLNEAIKLYHSAITYNDRAGVKNNLDQYQEAIQDFDKAIRLIPDDPTFYYHRGNARQKSGDYVRAIQDYNKTLELNPDYAKAYNNRGVAKAAQQDYMGAIQDYTEAIELKEDDADTCYNRGNAKKALGQDGDAKLDYAKAYYYWGQEFSNRDDYQAAVKNFDKSIELKPGYMTYYARGNAKHKNSDYEGAIQDCEKVIERKPDYAEAYYNLGVTHSSLNNYEVALDHFEKAIEKKPEFAEVHYNLGVTLHRFGNYKEALNHLSKAIELKEPVSDAKAYKARGRVQEDLGNEAEAKVDYAEAHYAWGYEALTERAEYSEAIKHFNALLDLLPEFARGYGYRGKAKEELGRSKAALGDLEGAQNLYQGAIEDLDKAISADPTLFYKNRGGTKLLRGAVRNRNDHNGRIKDYEAAIEDCTKAIKVYTMEAAQKQNWEDPEWISNFASAYHLRGMARCLLGYTKANQGRSKEAREQYKEAIKDFKKAINLAPNNASYYKGIGLANAALGKAKATLEAFEEAKKKEEETEMGK